jgi:hypothetical protein
MKHQTRLRFEYGGFFAKGITLRLGRGRLVYTKTLGTFPAQAPQAIKPTEEQWHQFWLEADHIGVWDWLPEYINHDIDDGVEWSLELSHSGRKIKCYGSNAYPGYRGVDYPDDCPFADFLRALARLTGQPDIAPPPPDPTPTSPPPPPPPSTEICPGSRVRGRPTGGRDAR